MYIHIHSIINIHIFEFLNAGDTFKCYVLGSQSCSQWMPKDPNKLPDASSDVPNLKNGSKRHWFHTTGPASFLEALALGTLII